jgi:predicted RNase H-like HicB family nuclease
VRIDIEYTEVITEDDGDTYEEALSDVKSAIRFHIETFQSYSTDSKPG